MSAHRGVFRRYFQHAWLPEATLVASCVVWLALMLAWKEWEALPFHFIYISVSVVYGLRMWHVRTAAIAIALVALTTGALTLIAVERGTEGPAELVEVPLMSLLYLTMVLHVSIRLRAARSSSLGAMAPPCPSASRTRMRSCSRSFAAASTSWATCCSPPESQLPGSPSNG
jgi:hypothetical protein